jgi:hypothetical protein
LIRQAAFGSACLNNQNMKNNALQYTFRVWITSVIISPLSFGLILIIRHVVSISELLDEGLSLLTFYVFLVVLQLLFSFVTWLIFLLLVNIVSLIPLPKTLIRLAISFIGILLTIGTFKVLNNFIDLIGGRDNLINLLYADCLGIGWGVWYYKLDIKAKEQNTTAEEI